MILRAPIGGFVVLGSVWPVSAQALRVTPVAELPAFDAAVVKPAEPTKAVPRTVAPDRVHRPVTTAMELITDAFAFNGTASSMHPSGPPPAVSSCWPKRPVR